MGNPCVAGGVVTDKPSRDNRITMEIPTTFDGRRVGAAYLQLRAGLAYAQLTDSEAVKRSASLTAVIGYMQDAHPELMLGDELAALKRLRNEMQRDTIDAITRDGGQPSIPAGETMVRCAAIAAVRFLRDSKAHGYKYTAEKARAEVAKILRSMGRTDSPQQIRKWEAVWLPAQWISPDLGVVAEADPSHTVDVLLDVMRNGHNLQHSPVIIARDVLRDQVRRNTP